jgi:hypothetical protein
MQYQYEDEEEDYEDMARPADKPLNQYMIQEELKRPDTRDVPRKEGRKGDQHKPTPTSNREKALLKTSPA